MNELLGLLALLVLISAIVLAISALIVLCETLFPRLVARTQATIEQMPRRVLAVGVVNSLFFGLLTAALASGGEGARLLALVVLTFLLSIVAIGITAIAHMLGERIPSEHSPLRRLLHGALVLQLAALTPIVGWVAVTCISIIIGCGATIIVIFRRKE
jgi:hypothetical protein